MVNTVFFLSCFFFLSYSSSRTTETHLWNVHKTAISFKPSHLQKRISKKVAQNDKIERTMKEVRAIPWAKNEARKQKLKRYIYKK